ncbi:DinB family protein [Natronoglycomyces albus]|uniref:DinB family protein n=1 Tax=Natronoglycomyces albus TaxID=2811108 RepID=A0A895XN90_9ACTN|nr:DinB family protein [Natronoglycomyces albus]QSB05003.1 DinB family protein [Natronoglycomyces albus]
MSEHNWTAPQAQRVAINFSGGERAVLENMLDWQRDTLMMKCAGLNAAELKRTPLDHTGISLLGLVRHLADVELFWFRFNLDGEQVPGYYHTMERPDACFEGVAQADAGTDFANFTESVTISRQRASAHELDDQFPFPFGKGNSTLRWIYVHVIQEYARHNGHADLLREKIDGTTGE